MKVEEKGHTIIIKDTQANAEALLMKVTHEHKTFEKHNLVIDISQDKTVDAKKIGMFGALSRLHRKAKKSFVIVASGIDFNAVPVSLNVVPSVLEAHDIIEMEEIERDLGF
jgi:anti-anti-sigma regulatory factor